MRHPLLIDVAFDVRSDAGGKDPDQHSATLREYHRRLWSKPLPNGVTFELSDSDARGYLHHQSELGEFPLASDSIVHTYSYWVRTEHIIHQIPEPERDEFLRVACTIGGYLVFPSNRVGDRPTINMHRGRDRWIADRIDLTLECIRRHYIGQTSPLAQTLDRYGAFFTLFEDFLGYVDFFLLDDLLTDDRSAVDFFLRFDDFATPAVPTDLEMYTEYRARAIKFVESRNRRIGRLGS